MMKHLLILNVIILFSSCLTEKKRAEICSNCPVKIVSNDTIIYRDTTVYITKQGEPVYIDSPCDTNGKLKPFVKTQTNRGIKTTITSKGNILTVQCDVDSLEQVIKRLKESSSNSTKTIVETKYKEHWYTYPLIYWFIFSLCTVIVYLIVKKVL